jgi:hypothetical protein
MWVQHAYLRSSPGGLSRAAGALPRARQGQLGRAPRRAAGAPAAPALGQARIAQAQAIGAHQQRINTRCDCQRQRRPAPRCRAARWPAAGPRAGPSLCSQQVSRSVPSSHLLLRTLGRSCLGTPRHTAGKHAAVTPACPLAPLPSMLLALWMASRALAFSAAMRACSRRRMLSCGLRAPVRIGAAWLSITGR